MKYFQFYFWMFLVWLYQTNQPFLAWHEYIWANHKKQKNKNKKKQIFFSVYTTFFKLLQYIIEHTSNFI